MLQCTSCPVRAGRIVTAIVALATIAAALLPWASSGAASLPAPAPNTRLGRIIPHKGIVSDPYVMTTSTADYLYASGVGSQTAIMGWKFHDLTSLGQPVDVTRALPSWSVPGTAFWSPDVRKVGGRYVLWFAAQYAASTMPNGQNPKCIGYAVSKNPLGPFVSSSSRPAICQLGENGDIDPRTFIGVGGKEFLYWKSDDNANATPYLPTKIWVARLATNGTTLTTQPKVIMRNRLSWEGTIVEAPQMVHFPGGQYYMFFAGNSSDAETNGIGMAHCKAPMGPCADTYRGPWLGSNTQGAGPGEESLFQQGANTWLLYTPNAIYYPFAIPGFAVARVAGGDGVVPYIANQTGVSIGF